jgi:enamine deaminase RidA (YjgF/YER057c/UK114 family)
MVTHKQIEFYDLHATIRLGRFKPNEGGVSEFHAMIEINAPYANAEKQYLMLEEAVQRLFKQPELKDATLVWKHFFVSDAINQSQYLNASVDEAVSIVQQPPLNCSKASLWLYFVEDVQILKDLNDATIMNRPHYKHLFSVTLHERSVSGSIEHQTRQIFNRYNQSLNHHKCTLERNCVRTWIYVQGIDVQYAGMVAARREYFAREGLTPETHFIASTGIEGRYIYPDVLVLIDAYAINGIQDDQIKYLHAPTHLNPTHEYGVTFERGTSIDYGDRRHIFISGTASINNRGEIVHPLDVEKQTERVFENIGALLSEAESSLSDVVQMIVYLRDISDFAMVNKYLEEHYHAIPRVNVLAPVCRPGWLVEVECIAIKAVENKRFAAF